VVRLIP
jgi:hypothetical protein